MLLVNVWSVIKFYRRAIITLWNLINATILAIVWSVIIIILLSLLLIYYYLLLFIVN